MPGRCVISTVTGGGRQSGGVPMRTEKPPALPGREDLEYVVMLMLIAVVLLFLWGHLGVYSIVVEAR